MPISSIESQQSGQLCAVYLCILYDNRRLSHSWTSNILFILLCGSRVYLLIGSLPPRSILYIYIYLPHVHCYILRVQCTGMG